MTYELIIEIALKSFVTSGVALLLLAWMRDRSAAERSWVAHIGLLATAVLPLAAVFLPKLYIEEPAPVAAPSAEGVFNGPKGVEAAAGQSSVPLEPHMPIDFGSIAFWLYALVAAALALTTLLAVVRLFMLRGSASVLVEPSWLSALAHAQRRMGFKHGTALLVSNALGSPVSWGVLRPIILLNEEAVSSQAEAEAIIAHELAHVAHLDWAKLLVARAATALFWFNPLVWLLARQCHQLREEAADDAVLLSDVPCTDYAALLIGAARHDSKPLLLAANGVAPGRGSLKRRVTRVLDTKLRRTPARIGWGATCTLAGLAVAAPLSAVTAVTPPASEYHGVAAPQTGRPAPLAVVAQAAASSAQEAIAAATGTEAVAVFPPAAQPVLEAPQPVRQVPQPAAQLTEAHPEAVMVRGPVIEGAVAAAIAQVSRDLTPELISRIRIASMEKEKWVRRVLPAPRSGPPTPEQLTGLKVHGVTADYIRALGEAGYTKLTYDELMAARIHGVTPEYIREMAQAGYPNLSIGQLTKLRIHRVTPAFIRGLADAGYDRLSFNDLMAAAVHRVSPEFIKSIAAAGYPGLPMSQLTAMRIHRVSPSFIQDLRSLGYAGVPPKQLIDMRNQRTTGSVRVKEPKPWGGAPPPLPPLPPEAPIDN